jgi:signal transduction histidine kinase/CheY-like chemotaxis protein
MRVDSAPNVVDLQSVIITDSLNDRPSRPPDYQAESSALGAVAQAITSAPEGILQALVETTLSLCKADSAGVSIAEEEGGGEILRWHAIAGRYASHRWGTTPRHFSPSGTVMDQNALVLFSNPARHFTYFNEVDPPIIEALMCPFAVGGKIIGTLWVMANDDRRQFDTEDGRLLGNLAKFAATAYQVRLSLTLTQEAQRRKDEFLAVLAHELRNLLAPMHSAVQYLGHFDSGQPEQYQASQVLGRQLKSMTRMIDDLLDVSRIGCGKLQVRKERVDLTTVLKHAVETCRPLMEAYRHELVLDIPSGAIWVDADPVRLAQVFDNLLNNAAKYTREDGRIELSAGTLGTEAVIRVLDHGLGVPADMLSRIFEPFTQVDSSLERSHGGLGIGLALVRSLVRMHDGTVEAYSAGLGHGSEFLIRLPIAPQTSEAPALPVPDERKLSLEGPKAVRILVVDDNHDCADSLAMLLRLHGYDVNTAYDGPSALRVAVEQAPQVILQDLGMPGMSGYEVAQQLRQQSITKDTVLLALSGYGTADAQQRSLEAGFQHHLVKPVDLSVLRRLIASVGQLQHAPEFVSQYGAATGAGA